MGRNKRPKPTPERHKEATEPDPEATPHVSREGKGQSSSRLEESREPSEDEEKRRVARKLGERKREF